MFKTRQYLKQYLLQCNQLETLDEDIRQSIAHNPYFQVVSAFQRFDKFRKGFLEPADFSEFMLENKVYPTQSELYLIFRDFDRQRIGVVTLDQFEEEILPYENRKIRKDALKRNPYPVQSKLSVDLQFLIGKYFQSKINAIKKLGVIQEKLKLSKPYAIDQCFLDIDEYRVGYISGKQEIDNFLRKNGKALLNQELQRIFRVLSFHSYKPVTLQIFRDHLAPFDQQFYPGYLQKVREKQRLEHRFLQKKYEAEIIRKQNIYKREELQHQIHSLRESNRRIQYVMDEQQIARLSDIRRYPPYY